MFLPKKSAKEPSKKTSKIVDMHGTKFSKSEAMKVPAAMLDQLGGDNAALAYSYNHCLTLHEEPIQLSGKPAGKRERAFSSFVLFLALIFSRCLWFVAFSSRLLYLFIPIMKEISGKS